MDAWLPATIYGLPLHVLVLHAAVVLLPLAASLTVLYAAAPRLRPMLKWPLLAVLLPAAASVPISNWSGEALKERLLESQALGGAALEKVEIHQALGEALIWPVLALVITVIALIVADARRVSRLLVTFLAVAAIVSAGVSIVQVVRTGHAGATAVWNPGA